MMDKYSLLHKIGIYVSLAIFILFMLLPFVEMFVASLRPITHLFTRPDVPMGETMSFFDFQYNRENKDVLLLGVLRFPTCHTTGARRSADPVA